MADGTPLQITRSKREWIDLNDRIADVLCWHMGFKAANPSYEAPPLLEQLRAHHLKLKEDIYG